MRAGGGKHAHSEWCNNSFNTVFKQVGVEWEQREMERKSTKKSFLDCFSPEEMGGGGARNLRKYFYSNELFKNLFSYRREHMAWLVSRGGFEQSWAAQTRHVDRNGRPARLLVAAHATTRFGLQREPARVR